MSEIDIDIDIKIELNKLYSLIEKECESESSAKNEIILELDNQRYKKHNFIFRSLADDLRVLLNVVVNEYWEAVESVEGTLISERKARFAHILQRLRQYVDGVYYENIATRLFDYRISKIKYLDSYIEVEEIESFDRSIFIVKDKTNGALYAKYSFDKGFAAVVEIHKLSTIETENYYSRNLNLEDFLNILVRNWFKKFK